MDYQVVFEASQQNLSLWPFLLVTLPVVIIILAWQRLKANARMVETSNKATVAAAISSVFFLITGCIASMAVVVAFGMVSNYNNAHAMLKEGRALVVEGKVTGYSRSTTGRDPGSSEEFFVNDVFFSYSESSESIGFHNVAKYGGPIRDDLMVRISYAHLPGDPSEPAILKLEIKR